MMNFKPSELRSGDIAACYGTGFVSKAISFETMSLIPPSKRLLLGPSHVAVMLGEGNDQLWVESTSLCPRRCVINNITVEGPQAHRPKDRIADYVRPGGRVDIYRPTPWYLLTQEEYEKAHKLLVEFLIKKGGYHYDMLGAVISGTRAFRLWPFFFSTMHEVFCSEMIAALMMRTCRLPVTKTNKFSPGRLMRKLVWNGVYKFVGEAVL